MCLRNLEGWNRISLILRGLQILPVINREDCRLTKFNPYLRGNIRREFDFASQGSCKDAAIENSYNMCIQSFSDQHILMPALIQCQHRTHHNLYISMIFQFMTRSCKVFLMPIHNLFRYFHKESGVMQVLFF